MANEQHDKEEHGMASTGDEDIQKIGIIGCGSMGGNMALLFAEKGLEVYLSDPSQKSIDTVLKQAKIDGLSERMQETKDYSALAEALPSPRVLLFSLPHGTIGDSVLHELEPYLRPGDIILDAGNENFENTQRRQGQCTTRGINYVGMGVSGGYQAARRGPSMCPGGDVHTLRPKGPVMRLLRKVAAKEGGNDTNGPACVAYAGFGGAGHYVKCLHNGIEHGMMSALAEAYDLMAKGLRMSLADMAAEFERWNTHKDSPLRNTFLVAIAVDICRAEDPEQNHDPVLPTVLDKVVQDLTGEEGTGVWSSMEAMRLHIPAPTLSAAHYLRIASAFRGRREATSMLFRDGTGVVAAPSALPDVDSPDKRRQFLDQLLDAVYAACLAAYVQGINVIEEANKEQGWHVDYAAVWQIWRAGCIIQSEHISAMLAPIFKKHGEPASASATGGEPLNMLRWPAIINELSFGYQALKRVVLAGTEHDFVTPALSATLEWIKYSGGKDLPTRFSEAQLDYFGKHMYDRKSESGQVPGPTEGRHHFEWKKA